MYIGKRSCNDDSRGRPYERNKDAMTTGGDEFAMEAVGTNIDLVTVKDKAVMETAYIVIL